MHPFVPLPLFLCVGNTSIGSLPRALEASAAILTIINRFIINFYHTILQLCRTTERKREGINKSIRRKATQDWVNYKFIGHPTRRSVDMIMTARGTVTPQLDLQTKNPKSPNLYFAAISRLDHQWDWGRCNRVAACSTLTQQPLQFFRED